MPAECARRVSRRLPPSTPCCRTPPTSWLICGLLSGGGVDRIRHLLASLLAYPPAYDVALVLLVLAAYTVRPTVLSRIV